MAIPEKDIQTIFKCYEEARYQDTKDLLDDAIDKDMNNHHIYYFKAICCIHMNQLDEALIALGEVAYLNPDYIPSMHALAYIFLRRGDFESAMNKWLAIKTVAPKDPLVNNILNKIKSKQIQKDFLNRYNMDDFIQLDAKELKRGLAFTVEELPLSNTKIPSPTPPPENRTLTSSQPDLITHSYSSSSRKKIFRWLITLCILLILFWIALSIYQTRNKNSTSLGFIKMNNEPVFFSFHLKNYKQNRQKLYNY